MRAALYYRVSTPGQVDAYGYNAQKRLLPEACERLGWTVVAEYREPGISGEHLVSRPAMMQMLADAERDRFDVILSIEDTRLSRGSIRDWEYLKGVCDDNEVSLATPAGIFYRPGNEDDDFITDIRGAISKREKRLIRQRMMRGKVEATKQGRIVHSQCPYGYEFEQVGRRPSHKQLVIVAEQAEVIRLIFRLAVHGPGGSGGIGRKRVSQYLNDRGIRTLRGAKWDTRGVERVIHQPAYKGEWYFGRWETRMSDNRKLIKRERPVDQRLVIPVPAIVEPELWEAAQSASEHRNLRGRGRPPLKNPKALLASYLRCPHCGYTMQRYIGPRRGTFSAHYVCTGRARAKERGGTPCHNHRWKAEDLEARVWQELVTILKSPQLLAELAQQPSDRANSDTSGELSVLRRRLAALDGAEARVREAYREGVYSVEQLREELATIATQRRELDDHVARAADLVAAAKQREKRIAQAVDRCQAFADRIDQADRDQKRVIIEALVDVVTISAEGELIIRLVFGPGPGDSGTPNRCKMGPTSKRLTSVLIPSAAARLPCARRCLQ